MLIFIGNKLGKVVFTFQFYYTIIYIYFKTENKMTFEQIAVGLQLVAIVAIVVGACVGPLLYVMWQNKKHK